MLKMGKLDIKKLQQAAVGKRSKTTKQKSK